MNKFLQKHAVTIVLVVVALSVGGFTDSVLDKIFPTVSAISKDVMAEIMVDALQDEEVQSVLIEIVQRETSAIKKDISNIESHNKILADNVAEEWVRIMHKQYLKVQTNRSDLSWADVEYALSKWPVLPDDWITPELEAKIEYLQIKYDEHIGNGGS